jgi:hypothetical protein
MFEDFEKSDSRGEGRRRMGVSLLISGVIFGGIAAALAAAIATAHVVVKRRQADVAVSFADLPRAPRPRPIATATTRGTTSRKAPRPRPAAAPKEIPAERPREEEGALAEAGPVGPVDGILEDRARPAPATTAAPPPPARPQPAAPPPEQETETIARPRFVAGCRAPEVPEALHSLAATITIDVRMMIGPDGKVRSASIVKPHPLIPDETILRCVRDQVFEPAHLPDGTAVLFPFHRRFVFKPA